METSIQEFPMLSASFSKTEQPQLSASLSSVVVVAKGGTMFHSQLVEREEPDQHPIEAITNLKESLEDLKFVTDETLSLKKGVLSVNVATGVDEDNTLPISSAAVAETVGNIEIILKTI